jgi:hypothetical protein
MKKVLTSFLLLSLLLFILMCLPALVSAQPGDPGCDPGCNCRADGSICPIDGGLSLLLAIGAGYGIKKARDIKKNKPPIQD